MYKKLISLFTVLSIAAIGYADNQNQDTPYSNQSEPYEKGDANSEVAQSSSDPRWYKSREGRQEYLKGGSDYPYRQSQYDSGDQDSPSSDSRWYKSRSGRQEYLKGGGNYPKSQN